MEATEKMMRVDLESTYKDSDIIQKIRRLGEASPISQREEQLRIRREELISKI
jgi:hypothetical protein